MLRAGIFPRRPEAVLAMHLQIEQRLVDEAREVARAIAYDVASFGASYSTVAVERAVLRLLGASGSGSEDVPLVNRFVELAGGQSVRRGIARTVGGLIAQTGVTPADAIASVARGELDPLIADAAPAEALRAALAPWVEAGLARIRARRSERTSLLARLPQATPPLLYVIVASGNIYEDRTA